MTHKERPLNARPYQVRAMLDGRMTQMRRVVKRGFMHDPTGPRNAKWYMRRADAIWDSYETLAELVARHCPHGKPGDRLWVREAVCLRPEGYGYRADNDPTNNPKRWIPSIHMPREAIRITLEITAVRVERLQDISEADAEAEGVDYIPAAPARTSHRAAFAGLWDGINGKTYPWESNPWVWVVEFNPL